MRVRLGSLFLQSDIREWVTWAEMSEEAGFEMVGVPDSQSVYRELYVTCALAALRTRRAIIGPWVANPLTRHPAVQASAIATIDEVSGGRAMLGLGTGHSATDMLGLKPASLESLREYVLAVKELFAKKETQYQGRTVRLTWPSRPVPVYIAGAGPKILRLAGQVADGVIVGSGLLPGVVRDSLAQIRQGALDAGRDPSSVDVWWLARCCVADRRQDALREIRAAIATPGKSVFRFGQDDPHVPPELRERVARLVQRYRVDEHGMLGDERDNARVVEELGLVDYLAERFAIVGTPEECAEQVKRAAAAGANQICLRPQVADKARFFRTWRERVMSHLS
ncbi:MAG: LLM class flavin-dependent oxidoreductase [Dehalococcoidia bacterium]|nr:LLM class flavin-dependent oxidoreductase [Dehalococcoidia bacterium]